MNAVCHYWCLYNYFSDFCFEYIVEFYFCHGIGSKSAGKNIEVSMCVVSDRAQILPVSIVLDF